MKPKSVIIWRKDRSIESFKEQVCDMGLSLENLIVIDDESRYADLMGQEHLVLQHALIFVLVEIDWLGAGDFQGLNIAKEMMDKYGKRVCLNFYFVSFLTRKMVMLNSEGQLFTIAKQFQHILLPIDKSVFKKPVSYSKGLYEYMYNSVFSPEFLYNLIEHTLAKLSLQSSSREFQDGIELLFKYRDSFDSPLRGKIESIRVQSSDLEHDVLTTYNDIQEIRRLLGNGMANLGYLPGLNKKEKYIVAIVDDSKEDIERLRRVLDRYFVVDDSFIFTNGEDCRNRLAHFERDKVRAIFLDQELLDHDGGFQLIQGIDLYEHFSSVKYKRLQIRLITSFSKEALALLYPDNLSIDRILFKKNGGYSTSNENLHLFFERLDADITRSLNDNLPGPVTGLFDSRYGLKDIYFAEENKQEMDMLVKNVTDTVTLFLSGELPSKSIQVEIVKRDTMLKLTIVEKKNKLKAILLHRLLILASYKKSSEICIEDDIDTFSTPALLFLHYSRIGNNNFLNYSTNCYNNHPAFNKPFFNGNKGGAFSNIRILNNKLSLLGFVDIKETETEAFNLSALYVYGFDAVTNMLFPHESDYLKML